LILGVCALGTKYVCSFQQSEKVPPPWLIAMQRYGPPPSYPNLKIPGLNNPIPEVSSTLARFPLQKCMVL